MAGIRQDYITRRVGAISRVRSGGGLSRCEGCSAVISWRVRGGGT